MNLHLVSFLQQGMERAKGGLHSILTVPVVMGRNTSAMGIQGNSPYLAQRNHLAMAYNQLEFPHIDINHSGATYCTWKADNIKLPTVFKLVCFFACLFIFPGIQENEVNSLLHMVKPRH